MIYNGSIIVENIIITWYESVFLRYSCLDGTNKIINVTNFYLPTLIIFVFEVINYTNLINLH